MTKIHLLGKRGENIAAEYLIRQGFRIRERNYRYLKAEIDIIAQLDELLVMVEVKSRTQGFYEDLTDTISAKKRGLMVMAADHYVNKHTLDLETRFDIILIIEDKERMKIDHIPNAFYHF